MLRRTPIITTLVAAVLTGPGAFAFDKFCIDLLIRFNPRVNAGPPPMDFGNVAYALVRGAEQVARARLEFPDVDEYPSPQMATAAMAHADAVEVYLKIGPTRR